MSFFRAVFGWLRKFKVTIIVLLIVGVVLRLGWEAGHNIGDPKIRPAQDAFESAVKRCEDDLHGKIRHVTKINAYEYGSDYVRFGEATTQKRVPRPYGYHDETIQLKIYLIYRLEMVPDIPFLYLEPKSGAGETFESPFKGESGTLTFSVNPSDINLNKTPPTQIIRALICVR